MVSLGDYIDEHHKSPPRPSAEPKQSGPGSYESNGGSVFDRFAEAASWADILEPLGWIQVKPADSATFEAWRHPDATHPISAHVLKVAPYAIVNWSENSGLPVGKDQDLTKAKAYAHLNYGGDLSAASKALWQGNAAGLPAHVVEACKAPPNNTLGGPFGMVRPSADQSKQDDQVQPEPDYDTNFAEEVEREARKIKVREAAKRKIRTEQNGPLPPFDAGTLRDMLARPQPPQARVDGLIPWEASTLIPAQRKTGKTTLLLNLSRSLLTGEAFLGTFEVQPVDGLVALLNYEVSGDTIARWADEAGLDHDRFFLVNLRGRRNPLADHEDRDRLAQLLRQRGTESLLVDPFGRAYTGQNQNDPGEVGSFLIALDRFARGEVGARDLILTTHAGWNQERTRGSSALEDWADSIITMTRDDSEDGDGERYLRAIGRDVDLEEDQLNYDPGTRTLTLAGSGSRKAAKDTRRHDKLDKAVLDLITAEPGLNTTEIADKVRAAGVSFQRGDIGHTATRLIDAGHLRMESGPRNAKKYYPTENLFDGEKTTE
jgi:hypothetical protein